MPGYEHSSTFDVPVQQLFDWHARPGAVERLAPPWQRIRIVERAGGIQDGARLVFDLLKGPLRVRWEALHRDYRHGRSFTDEQVRGPFRRWLHTHDFAPTDVTRSTLTDHIQYELPLRPVGRWLGGRIARRALERMFAWRHARTRFDVTRHGRHADRGPMRVAIAGASGLVGSNLVAFLTTGGHEVLRLVRPRSAELVLAGDGTRPIQWDPRDGTVDAEALEGLDAVIHLGGVNIAGGRWTPERKALIRDSRVDSTRLLSRTLAGLTRPPRVFLCASAVGFYGNRGDETVDEASEPGEGFLAETCMDWEAASQPAREAGIRVVNLRTGLVLSRAGGALRTMLPAFKAGVAGRLGSGQQYMSWIALDDLVGLIHHLLHTDEVSGPINAVAPQPVTNREFTKTLGRVLHRPTILPAPASAIRLALGELGEALLLGGQRVAPSVATAAGFRFLFPELESGLRWELGLPGD